MAAWIAGCCSKQPKKFNFVNGFLAFLFACLSQTVSVQRNTTFINRILNSSVFLLQACADLFARKRVQQSYLSTLKHICSLL